MEESKIHKAKCAYSRYNRTLYKIQLKRQEFIIKCIEIKHKLAREEALKEWLRSAQFSEWVLTLVAILDLTSLCMRTVQNLPWNYVKKLANKTSEFNKFTKALSSCIVFILCTKTLNPLTLCLVVAITKQFSQTLVFQP